jgi:hypothetical protein
MLSLVAMRKPLTRASYSATLLVAQKCSRITSRSQSPLGVINTTPLPTPLRVKESSKYMLQCSWVTEGGGLSLGPFGYKIYQGLGLDHCLRYVGYVKPHKLECPLDDPPRGELIPDDFSEPK